MKTQDIENITLFSVYIFAVFICYGLQVEQFEKK